MFRLLMASTAIAAVLATSSFAQDASSSAPMDASSTMDSTTVSSSSAMDSTIKSSSSMMDSSMMESSAMSSQMMDASSVDSTMMSSQPGNAVTTVAPRQSVQILSGYTRADTDNLASKIIGRTVFDGTGTDANNLGNVTDLVVNQNGEVSAVILGVGGFLGLGQKQVAVDFAALQWVVADDNTERYVLQTTKDDLTNAPDFVTVDDQPGDASANTVNGMNASSAMDTNGNNASMATSSDALMPTSSVAQ